MKNSHNFSLRCDFAAVKLHAGGDLMATAKKSKKGKKKAAKKGKK